jgi:hypothetical protein
MDYANKIFGNLKKLKWTKAILKSLEEFMQHTSLHAYQYLIKSERPALER